MALSPKGLVCFWAGISGRNPRLEGCLPKPVLEGSRGRVPFLRVLVVFAGAVRRRVLMGLADALGPVDLLDVRSDHRGNEGLPIFALEDPMADRGPREPLAVQQRRRERLQAVVPEQPHDEVGVRVDNVEARDEGRDMADPHAVHVGVGDRDDVVVVDPLGVEALLIISYRSPAVKGFSPVWLYWAEPIPTMISSLDSRIRLTIARCPRWNGWNRPMKKARPVIRTRLP